MSYYQLILVLFVVAAIAAVLGMLGDRNGPPATRAELDRAERDNKPDISPALERDAAALDPPSVRPRSRAPSLVVVVVQAPDRNDDPRRWN